MNDNIEIWCDGGCRGNSKDENIGGWGARLFLPIIAKRSRLSGIRKTKLMNSTSKQRHYV